MDYLRIIQMLLDSHTYAEITASMNCSRRDISTAKKAIETHQITTANIGQISHARLAEIFPDKRKVVSAIYSEPDFELVAEKLQRNRFFTLQQAWMKYTDLDDGQKKYSYSRFCSKFQQHMRTHDLVATLQHEPGKAMFVDWAGPTLAVVDAVTGEQFKAYFFVASLPYSSMVFAKAYPNMRQDAWNRAHVDALEFFGGVPQMIVPDNAKTATHYRQNRKNSAQGEAREVVVTKSYAALADHYGTAIVPARPGKPRDKAHVERMVQVVETMILGYLAEVDFESFEELNEAVRGRLDHVNSKVHRTNGVSRAELFASSEAERLKPLPSHRFEQVEYKQLKVGPNYHVNCDYQYYSVPYQLVGRTLSVRLTQTRVTVIDGSAVVAEHARLEGRRGQHSTLQVHIPVQHKDVSGLWSRDWFIAHAQSFGPATVEVIVAVLDRAAVEAQAFVECRNIVKGLGAKHRSLLEPACKYLLDRGGYSSYSGLKRIIAAMAQEEKSPARTAVPVPEAVKDLSAESARTQQFVRAPGHYSMGGGQ
ncbi:IS21 family transposase [Glutamicibacter soli]|uniref:IS21 family transposase n=1 Tax=Glutamicibacter soli TaxID=453836 RepID=A0A6L9G7T8_9MICC|nr:IS21 family transposase [Glutamicibacter soli]NAZ17274.1 IS21 family transposase [Glutamicibacter soli]